MWILDAVSVVFHCVIYVLCCICLQLIWVKIVLKIKIIIKSHESLPIVVRKDMDVYEHGGLANFTSRQIKVKEHYFYCRSTFYYHAQITSAGMGRLCELSNIWFGRKFSTSIYQWVQIFKLKLWHMNGLHCYKPIQLWFRQENFFYNHSAKFMF